MIFRRFVRRLLIWLAVRHGFGELFMGFLSRINISSIWRAKCFIRGYHIVCRGNRPSYSLNYWYSRIRCSSHRKGRYYVLSFISMHFTSCWRTFVGLQRLQSVPIIVRLSVQNKDLFQSQNAVDDRQTLSQISLLYTWFVKCQSTRMSTEKVELKCKVFFRKRRWSWPAFIFLRNGALNIFQARGRILIVGLRPKIFILDLFSIISLVFVPIIYLRHIWKYI